MSGVDNRIVTMKFDNREFESNAKTSLTTLQKLKESMNFGSIVSGTMKGLGSISGALSKLGMKTPFAPMITAAQKGLSGVGSVLDKLGLKNPFSSGVQGAGELQRAAQVAGGPTGMGVLEGGVTAVSSKFIALTTIAVTALSNITNKAINAGTAFAKSFTIAPITDGLREYETNLQSIQTVQANTDRPLTEINKSLDQLNKYSDQTIYNFSQMARNVGTFTAAGVDLQTSVASIKGIANLAALSGSTSEQAASAMYQLSQAIAAGKVGLMDWNSVVNAGMGGKKLQNALAQTAIAMGKIDAAQVKGVKSGEQLKIMGASFRESIMAKPGEESWLTSDILVNTLATMDGRFSETALAAEKTASGLQKYSKAQIQAKINTARTNLETKNGVKFTDEQFKALQKMSTQAFRSATEVKTLGQVFDVAKETIGSGWSASFRNIFGNLKEAKQLFTGMSNGLNDIINRNSLARNKLLVAWKKQGGRETLIDGLKQGFIALQQVIAPIRAAFRDLFPAMTAKRLVDITKGFKAFMISLVPTRSTVEGLYQTFRGVFSIFSIVGQVIGAVVRQFGRLFGAIGEGTGGFLSFTSGIGDSIYEFDKFLKQSGVLTSFFDSLGNILAVPLTLLKGIATLIGGIFTGFDTGAVGKVGDAVEGVGQHLSGLQAVGERLQSFFQNVGEFFGNLGGHIANALMGIGDVVASAFTPETFSGTLAVINTTLLGGLVLLIRNFFTQGVKIDLTGGFFDSVKETLGSVTGAFESMQARLKADILLRIAAAIGVMAAALLVLSMIDPGALTKALAAMTGGFGVLIGAVAVMMKVLGPVGLVQLYVISSAMTKMAASILLLSFALKTLSGIDFGAMLRGLVGLSAMMFVLTKAMVPLAAGSKGMARASTSLILMGIALNILALALKVFATLSWEEMIKGLAGMTATLLILSGALKIMPDMKASGVSLMLLAVAMNILAVALKVFATMSWEEMAKGLVMLAGSLGIIAVAIRLMPRTMMLQAAALVAVAGAMVVLSGALKVMGSMGWENIAKGLVVMGGAMLILAVGLQAIGLVGTIGAVGLLAAASAMAIFLPVILAFGAMKWSSILKSLTVLAGIFVILGVAGYVLAPVVPVIIGLGAALLLLGAGIALAGAGALAAATAFGIVVAAGAAGAQIMIGFLVSIIKMIPPAMAAFGKGVVQFAVAIGEGAPRIAAAFGKVLSNLITQVIKNTPKLGRMFLVMLNTALRVIVTAIPRIANAGLTLIVKFLDAISRHLPRIIDLATDIIVKFINGIARNQGRIIQSGVNFIIKFIEGVAQAIRNNSERLGAAGADLGLAMVEGMANGIRGAGGRIKDAALGAAQDAWNSVKSFFKIGSPSKLMRDEVGARLPQGMALGIKDDTPLVTGEIKKMGRTAMDKLGETMSGLNDAFAMDPNLNPTVTPVLDLGQLAKEANKMSSILATAPIMPSVSYRAAADISAVTQASAESGDGPGGTGGGGGDVYEITYEQHLHSPTPLDSVKIYRDGKSLIALKKEELTGS